MKKADLLRQWLDAENMASKLLAVMSARPMGDERTRYYTARLLAVVAAGIYQERRVRYGGHALTNRGVRELMHVSGGYHAENKASHAHTLPEWG